MADSSADPLVGQTLNGRFKITEPLGVGGMGRVYKAIQSPLDRIIALKVLNPRYAAAKDPGFERRFFLEAAMTAKLKHSNTITVHDYGRTDNGIYFIAMEYVEGETLQKVLQRDHVLPWPRALHIGGQICRSLREAHKLGLVHRDLKPANVMLLREETDSDMVKVLDFGLVKSFMPEGPVNHSTELTQAGVLLGSPLYMAPEQAKNETDPRSDIYSLGVLMYQCISGRPPFHGSDSIDIIVKHIREKPQPLRNLMPEVPLEVNALVMKCLEKEPANRFQSMDEVIEAMRQAGSGVGMSGAFSDPRSFAFRAPSSVQVPIVPVQGRTPSHKSQPTVMPPPRTQTRGDRGEIKRVEIASPSTPDATDEAVSIEVSLSERSWVQDNRGLLIAVGSALAVLLVSFVVWMVRRPAPEPAHVALDPIQVHPEHPRPDPKAGELAHNEPRNEPKPAEITHKTEPAMPPSPAPVTFHVLSSPLGANVTLAGKPMGVTPVDLEVERTEDGKASAEMTLSLDGFQSITFTAQGADPVVEVKQTLRKLKVNTPVKRPPQPGKPKETPGYKDDPYQ